MRLLLDTHIWIWSLSNPARVAPRILKALHDQENELWLSPISIWELVILVEKGRLEMKMDIEEWMAQATRIPPVKEAPLTAEVVLATTSYFKTLRKTIMMQAI